MLYELALQRANSIADYTLHIGDSYIHDVLGALTDATEKSIAAVRGVHIATTTNSL